MFRKTVQRMLVKASDSANRSILTENHRITTIENNVNDDRMVTTVAYVPQEHLADESIFIDRFLVLSFGYLRPHLDGN